MERNRVLYILVLVCAVTMFSGCGIVYHGAYSGKAPNSYYRGDNQGTPGLRVKPMDFGLTQEQLQSMNDEDYEKLMERMARYNELMRDSSYSEGYDASMKSKWTRYPIAAPQTPQSIPSRSEMRALRQAELAGRAGGDQQDQQRVFTMPPKPIRANFPTDYEYRQAYKAWLQLGKSFQGR